MKRTSRPSGKRVRLEDDVSISVTGGNDSFKIAVTVPPALGGGAGFITAWVEDVDEDERLFTVNEIDVRPKRRGIGTLLWTAAAIEAERRGGHLASAVRISHQAESFWQKQVRKGRASSRPGGEGPHGSAPIYVLRSGVRDLSNNPSPTAVRASRTANPVVKLSTNQLEVLQDIASGRTRKPAGYGANAASAWNRGRRALQVKGLVTWSSPKITDLGRLVLERLVR